MSFRVYVCAPGPRDGKNWILVCKAPAGSGARPLRRSSGTDDRAEAERIAAQREAELNAGLSIGAPRTVGDVLAAYLAHAKATQKASTAISVRVCLARLEPIGAVPLAELGRRHVVGVRDALAGRLDGKTVNLTMGKGKIAFRWANEAELTEVAWPSVQAVATKRTKKEPYSASEVRRILAWAEQHQGGHYAPLLNLLFETGARAGEVLGLRGRDLRRDESKVYFGQTKTGDPRWSGVTPATMARLPEVGPDEVLFRSRQRPSTGALSVVGLNLILKKARQQLGIVGALDTHSTRRTHATEAEAAGVSERVAMKQQGHASVAQHRAYKARSRSDDLVEAATKTAGRWAPLTEETPIPHQNPPQVENTEGDQWLSANSELFRSAQVMSA